MTTSLATETGTLYVVATPIGNREDISARALAILGKVNLIVAEDTRHSLPLLSSFGIKTRLESLHAHNEQEKSKFILEKLLHGMNIALISDAGTPLISDPGFTLVRLAREHQVPVVPIPGPCAITTALCAAGVPCETFLFHGFLPAKEQARKTLLQSLVTLPHTLIFYESTHRIHATLSDLQEIYGRKCEMVLAKELTKSFERFVHGTIADVSDWLSLDPAHRKGEFVLIIPPRPTPDQHPEYTHVLSVLLAEFPLKQAVNLASKLLTAPKNKLYDMALIINEQKKN